ncbi:MAG: hypothetical protein HFI50_11795 [Lachnospiraceae bacterium]|nr:hypothetical protein [Lachnospiraceae bacterium]
MEDIRRTGFRCQVFYKKAYENSDKEAYKEETYKEEKRNILLFITWNGIITLTNEQVLFLDAYNVIQAVQPEIRINFVKGAA